MILVPALEILAEVSQITPSSKWINHSPIRLWRLPAEWNRTNTTQQATNSISINFIWRNEHVAVQCMLGQCSFECTARAWCVERGNWRIILLHADLHFGQKRFCNASSFLSLSDDQGSMSFCLLKAKLWQRHQDFEWLTNCCMRKEVDIFFPPVNEERLLGQSYQWPDWMTQYGLTKPTFIVNILMSSPYTCIDLFWGQKQSTTSSNVLANIHLFYTWRSDGTK